MDAGVAAAGAHQRQYQQPLEPRRRRVVQVVGELGSRPPPPPRNDPGSAASAPSAPAETASTDRGRARRNAPGPPRCCGPPPSWTLCANGGEGQVVAARAGSAHQFPGSTPGERPLERPGRRRAVAQELGAADAGHGIDQRLTVAGSAGDRDAALPPLDARVEVALVELEQRHRRVDGADNRGCRPATPAAPPREPPAARASSIAPRQAYFVTSRHCASASPATSPTSR